MSDHDNNKNVPPPALTSPSCSSHEPEQVALSSADQPSKAEPLPIKEKQPQSFPSAEVVSKASAIVLVLLYMSGFLITSLHDFRFGFSEMNPLRPRILAAGGWFAIFIAVPFAFVWELRKHSAINDKSNVLNKASALIAAYMGSAIYVINFSGNLFSFDDDVSTPSNQPSPPMWAIAAIVVGVVIAIFAVVAGIAYFVSKLKVRPPKWVLSLVIILFYGYIAVAAYIPLFVKHSFRSNAMYFWIFIVGGFIYFEFSQRNWSLTIGQWYRTLIGFLVILTIFATIYYPHIKAKWGGGTLIPVELTFSKDASSHAGTVDCSLIDETDAGFYLIAKDEKFATFIPRAEITSIYYGQANKHALLLDSPPPSRSQSPDSECKSTAAVQLHAEPSMPESPASARTPPSH